MPFASKCKPFHLSVVDGMNEYLNWFVAIMLEIVYIAIIREFFGWLEAND